MILPKNPYYQSLSWVVSLTLFSTGITFCGVIWLIDIAAHILESGNYLISAPSPYFNYWVLCEFIFGGFCILALIFILKKESRLLALALMVSCASIAINTVLLKKISSLSHREWISTLEQLIQDENTHIGTSIFYKQEYRQYVKLWNLVEADKIEPNTNLYRVQIHLNDKDLLSWDHALDKIEGILSDHLDYYIMNDLEENLNDLEEHLNDGIYIKIDNVEDHHLNWNNVSEILTVSAEHGFPDVLINNFRYQDHANLRENAPHLEDTDVLIIQKKGIGLSESENRSVQMSAENQYDWDLIHVWCKRNVGKFAAIFFGDSVTFGVLEEVGRIFDAQGVPFALYKVEESSDPENRSSIKLELFTNREHEQQPNQASESTSLDA